ncbi:MAG: alpha/beta hydrolase [Bacteroidales bacterium]
MKKLITLFATLLAVFAVQGQPITGQWSGILKVQGVELTLVFNIHETEEGLSASMDSPDQGAFGIQVTTITFRDSVLMMEVAPAGIQYEGIVRGEVIQGVFIQAGQEFPLNLSHKPLEDQQTKRPQEPQPPYPYHSEEIIFHNQQAGINLSGTLTLPEKEGRFPAVILISGSGPQNRDEEVFGHKPFLVLADHLTRKGIAVLRFDDRGVGQSEGDFAQATSYDFAEDVEHGLDFLLARNDIETEHIGLLGHSEGGMIAPIVAAERPGDVGFIVLLAAPGVPGRELLLMQQQAIGQASGLPAEEMQKNRQINEKLFQMLRDSENEAQLRQDITQYLEEAFADTSSIPPGMSREQFISMQVQQLASPWMINFLAFDPATVLRKVEAPVLAINGSKDLQVPAQENLQAIEQALEQGGNEDVTAMPLEGLNHLFQESQSGLPNEYGTIKQTFSPIALEVISSWIVSKTTEAP